MNHWSCVVSVTDKVKTRVSPLLWDKSGRNLTYWPDGLRHKDGVNLIQALMWNVGTCRSDVKGEAQVEAPQEPEYQSRAQGRSIP